MSKKIKNSYKSFEELEKQKPTKQDLFVWIYASCSRLQNKTRIRYKVIDNETLTGLWLHLKDAERILDLHQSIRNAKAKNKKLKTNKNK